jgi:molybdopterin converting factor small subunit
MQVTVKLFATFRQYLPPIAVDGACTIHLTSPISVRDALGRAGLPVDKLDGAVILVNGRQSNLDQRLDDGDIVSAFPAMAGGGDRPGSWRTRHV